MQSNTIQPNPTQSKYPNLKNQKTETNWWKIRDPMVAEDEQRFSLLQTLFFVRLFDGLEHASLICVYMDLQRRIASYNQSES